MEHRRAAKIRYAQNPWGSHFLKDHGSTPFPTIPYKAEIISRTKDQAGGLQADRGHPTLLRSPQNSTQTVGGNSSQPSEDNLVTGINAYITSDHHTLIIPPSPTFPSPLSPTTPPPPPPSPSLYPYSLILSYLYFIYFLFLSSFHLVFAPFHTISQPVRSNHFTLTPHTHTPSFLSATSVAIVVSWLPEEAQGAKRCKQLFTANLRGKGR